jgi:hypothetical protein
MTLLGRLIEWLRRKRVLDDGPRIVRKGDRCEREPEVGPLEELVRIVGDASGDAARPRTKLTNARRIRSRTTPIRRGRNDIWSQRPGVRLAVGLSKELCLKLLI